MRIRKLTGLFTALAIALMTTVISIPSAAASSGDAQFANRLYVLINDYRAQHALAPLRWNDQMSAESQAWTQQSADQANIHGAGVFQHSPGSYAFPENIVWNLSADQAFGWWVNSPEHRANMLRAADTDIGLGAVQLTAGPNQGAYLATAKFGQYAVSAEDEAAAREAEARAAAEKAAQEAAARAAAEEAAAKAAAEKAAQEAAASAAAEEAAARAAQQAEAEKAAADAAAEEAAANAAAEAAAEEAAAKAAEEAAAAKPDTKPADQDKAAQEAAVKKAAEEAAAQEAAVQEAAEKAAAAKAAQEAAVQRAAEEAAAQKAAEDAAAAEAVESERLAAEEQATADAALAQEQAANDAAAQATAEKEATQTAVAAKAAAEEEARRAAAQATVKASTGVATVEQVTIEQASLGQDPILTAATRGTVAAVASGSRLRISGLNAGAAYEVVLPSAGVNLGAVNADTNGSLAAAVPAALPAGEHKVALFRDGALAGWTTFTVEQAVTVLAAHPVPAAADRTSASDGTAELAATGLNAAQLAIGGIGALMALTGGAALVALQRQRAASVR